MGLLLTPLTAWIYSWINTRRDALDDGRYDNMTVEESKALGDRAPDFHYSLWRNSHLSYHVISFHFRKEDGVTGNEGTIVFWSNNVTSSFVDAIIILCGNWERQGKLRVLLIQVYFFDDLQATDISANKQKMKGTRHRPNRKESDKTWNDERLTMLYDAANEEQLRGNEIECPEKVQTKGNFDTSYNDTIQKGKR